MIDVICCKIVWAPPMVKETHNSYHPCPSLSDARLGVDVEKDRIDQDDQVQGK